MGAPSFDPAEIPFRPCSNSDSVTDVELPLAGRLVVISALSVGNPQCVVFKDALPDEDEFDYMGRALSEHASFPQDTNVSFVQVTGRQNLKIKIWERGVGPTFSSGTGCCGAAVAAIAEGRVESPVEVQTETGVQVVEWQPGESIALTGEACFVADAEIFLR